MRNAGDWEPTRFVPVRRGWRASRDPARMSPGSRFAADRAVVAYQRLLKVHARGRLLDLGCGAVPLYGVYRGLVDSTVCVDWPHGGYGTRHLDAFVDLNRPLPFPEARFDTILSTDVLEHIARPGDLLREIARVLAPGGKLLLTVPFLYWIHEQPHDYFRYTEFALRRLCEEAGLDVHSCEPYGGAREVVLDIVAKHAGRISPVLAAIGIAVGRLCSLPLRPVTDRTRDRFPLGYCVVAARLEGSGAAAPPA